MGSPGNIDRPPVAVFAYNRPEKLAAMMRSLQACRGFAESPVTVFVDGPKPNPEDRSSVEAVRAFVRGLNSPNVSWSFQDTNRGLRQSIYDGVTELTKEHGQVIVFEDDLVVSPIALDYFNAALCRYQSAHRVWSIVGYAYDAPPLRNLTATLTLPFTHPWGWATWGRAWDRFSLDNQPTANQLNSQSFRSAFDMNGLYPFTALLKNSIEGRVNSWFIHWYYTVFQHGGVSIFPSRRIVDNFGHSDGSHGGVLNPYDRLVKRPQLLDTLPEFGDPHTVDYEALDSLRRSHELRVQRFIALAGRTKRTLRQRGEH
ncbi:hypothetical protein ABIA65_004031 [Mycolicibacterium sp. 624]